MRPRLFFQSTNIVSSQSVGSSKSMNCKMLITDMYFTSNLTKIVLSKNRSYDDLICKSTNVVYDLECNLCGLVYVGKKGGLNTRMLLIYTRKTKISEKKKRDEIIFA